jgi:hypothetical protein
MNPYDELPHFEEQSVPLPHEHQFIIRTENWEYAQRTVTLRMCSTCGSTHVLVWSGSKSFVWEEVRERMVL